MTNALRLKMTLLVTLSLVTSLLAGGSVMDASTSRAASASASASAAASASASAESAAAVDTAAPDAASNPAPYRIRTFTLQSLTWSQLWTNNGPMVGYAAYGHKDADGIPMRRWVDGKFYYSPVKIGIEGIEHLDSYVRTNNDPGYIPLLLKLADKLRQLAVVSGNAWFLPMPFDFGLGHLKAPWYNAMAQGYALSFFVRMYRIFGNPADLDAANHIFRSFQIIGPIPGPWVSQVVHGSLWLEHYPKGKYLEVLNAHMHALFGLYDYWQQVGTPEARQLLLAVITTMRHDLPKFRRPGKISRYCLVNPVYSMKYHRLHIRQVRELYLVTADSWFKHFADLLVADVS